MVPRVHLFSRKAGLCRIFIFFLGEGERGTIRLIIFDNYLSCLWYDSRLFLDFINIIFIDKIINRDYKYRRNDITAAGDLSRPGLTRLLCDPDKSLTNIYVEKTSFRTVLDGNLAFSYRVDRRVPALSLTSYSQLKLFQLKYYRPQTN